MGATMLLRNHSSFQNRVFHCFDVSVLAQKSLLRRIHVMRDIHEKLAISLQTPLPVTHTVSLLYCITRWPWCHVQSLYLNKNTPIMDIQNEYKIKAKKLRGSFCHSQPVSHALKKPIYITWSLLCAVCCPVLNGCYTLQILICKLCK